MKRKKKNNVVNLVLNEQNNTMKKNNLINLNNIFIYLK